LASTELYTEIANLIELRVPADLHHAVLARVDGYDGSAALADFDVAPKQRAQLLPAAKGITGGSAPHDRLAPDGITRAGGAVASAPGAEE